MDDTSVHRLLGYIGTVSVSDFKLYLGFTVKLIITSPLGWFMDLRHRTKCAFLWAATPHDRTQYKALWDLLNRRVNGLKAVGNVS